MGAGAVDRDLLKKVPLFARLGAEQLEALAAAASTRRLAAGEELFHKGDRAPQVYVIARGRLAVSSASADGNQVVLNLMDEGEVVGELALLATGRRSASVKAVEPSEVVVLERRDFLGYLREHPELALELLGLLAERVVRISEFVEDVVLLGLPARLARKLLHLAERYGEPDGDTIRISASFSQTELGELVGTSRESINKQLAAWKSDGLVRMERGEITLLRPAELERLAGLLAT
jgi:CRP-like cAMP-binding protein